MWVCELQDWNGGSQDRVVGVAVCGGEAAFGGAEEV